MSIFIHCTFIVICLLFLHSTVYLFVIFYSVLRVFSDLLEQSIIMRIAILAVLALLVPMTMAGKTQIQSYKIEHSYRDYNVYIILQPLICFIYRTLQTGCQREDADVQIARDDFSNATVPTLAHVSTQSSQFFYSM